MTSEAIIILPNMRGGCATVDGKVHTLFRLNNRRRVELSSATAQANPPLERPAASDSQASA